MTRVPRPMPGFDPRSLRLNAREAQVLSGVDSVTNESELARRMGIVASDVSLILDQLALHGAIDFAEEPKANGVSPGGPLYDPKELEEDVDIPVEKRQRILETFYRLDDLTYYELLGVPRDADKKRIKSAYYAAAPEFHPDKFFRKNIGSFKHKIEAIFGRITLAQDVLTNKVRRAEYDEYLEQTNQNRNMAALLEQSQREIADINAAVEASAKAMVAELVSQPPPPPVRVVVPPRPLESVQSRRETLARKLGGRLRPGMDAKGGSPGATGAGHTNPAPSVHPQPGRFASTPPAAPSGASSAPPPAQDPRAALKARYQAARAEALRQQLIRHLAAAKEAYDRQDYATAANSYRIAASLAPEDADLQRTCSEATHFAAVALAEGLWKQANYEAQTGHWNEAALSYAKVCSGRPNDPAAHDRAAHALLASGGNVRKAVEFARRAVELAPSIAEYRVTLARTYFSAGLEKSGIGELERAGELAPGDVRIKELIGSARESHQRDRKLG